MKDTLTSTYWNSTREVAPLTHIGSRGYQSFYIETIFRRRVLPYPQEINVSTDPSLEVEKK
jgi:hypothetical protein